MGELAICENRHTLKLSPNDLGIRILPSTDKLEGKYFQLIDNQVNVSESLNSGGRIVFIVHDLMGHPRKDIDVLLCWGDGITTTSTDGSGRASLMMWHQYDPRTKPGPYWAAMVDASDEIHGLGILPGYWVEIKLFFEEIDGSTINRQ